MHNIAIVKASSLGDIIHALPVASFVKMHHPEASVTWVVEEPFADMVRACPLVDHVIAIDSKGWRRRWRSLDTWRALAATRRRLQATDYDLVIDLQGNVKAACCTALLRSSNKVGFGKGYVAEWPNMLATHHRHRPPSGQNIRDDYLFLAAQALHKPFVSAALLPPIAFAIDAADRELVRGGLAQRTGPAPYTALILPGTLWRNKQLSEKTLADLLSLLHHDGRFNLLLGWGSSHELLMAQRLQSALPQAQLIDKLPLPLLQHLMSQVDLVMAMDSLPLHLAATAGTATFSFFGPSLAAKYAPEGPWHGYFQGPCPYGVTFTKRCPKLRSCKTGWCLRGLAAEVLYEAFCRWWAALPPR